jgi:hypothetical protein
MVLPGNGTDTVDDGITPTIPQNENLPTGYGIVVF